MGCLEGLQFLELYISHILAEKEAKVCIVHQIYFDWLLEYYLEVYNKGLEYLREGNDEASCFSSSLKSELTNHFEEKYSRLIAKDILKSVQNLLGDENMSPKDILKFYRSPWPQTIKPLNKSLVNDLCEAFELTNSSIPLYRFVKEFFNNKRGKKLQSLKKSKSHPCVKLAERLGGDSLGSLVVLILDLLTATVTPLCEKLIRQPILWPNLFPHYRTFLNMYDISTFKISKTTSRLSKSRGVQKMSRFLHKKKGFHHKILCMICGGKYVAGLDKIEKHWTSIGHIRALERLGIIRDFHKYKHLKTQTSVLALHNSLENDKFDPNDDTEVFDSQGSVMSKKTLADLKQLGLA